MRSCSQSVRSCLFIDAGIIFCSCDRQQYYRICGRLRWVETCSNVFLPAEDGSKIVFFNFVYVFFSKQTSLVLELWATNLPWLKSTRRITKAKGLKSRRVMMLYCKDWKDVGQQGAATTKAEYVQMILVWCCIWCMCKCAKSWKAWKIVEAFTDGLLKILTAPPTSFLRRMHRLRAEYVSLRLRRERCKHLKKN